MAIFIVQQPDFAVGRCITALDGLQNGIFRQADGKDFGPLPVIRQNHVNAGVSTGLVYHGALEIEIATKPAYQRQGLAKILGAQMILEAQKRSLFPLWDAHNEASKKVAESLGYQCLGVCLAYEWKGTFDR